MPFKARIIVFILAAFVVAAGLSPQARADHRPLLPEVAADEDGLHKQPWFHDSFLNLQDDLAEAAEAGKRLVIIWEQRGCPYCEKTHKVNFRNGDVVDYQKEHFLTIQLNLWGDREVTDLDGEVMSEKELANKWGVRYTPTLNFMPLDTSKVTGKSGKDAAVHTLFGYFFPYHYITTLQYVVEKGYETEPNFQRYLIAKGKAILDQGGHVDFFDHHLPQVPKDGKKH